MVPADPVVAQMQSVDRPRITVEIAVSVAPRNVLRVRLQVPEGCTVREALLSSGLMSQVPGLTFEALAAGQWAFGVWGHKERPGHVLCDQDRIELVRPLVVDPKEARRLRYQDHLKKWPKGSQRLNKVRPKRTTPSNGV